MNGGAQRPDTASTRRKLTLPRWLLLLLVMTVWPLLAFLFHGLLPCVLSGMARHVGWVENRPGSWNWAGLGLVGPAAIGLLWFLVRSHPAGFNSKDSGVEIYSGLPADRWTVSVQPESRLSCCGHSLVGLGRLLRQLARVGCDFSVVAGLELHRHSTRGTWLGCAPQRTVPPIRPRSAPLVLASVILNNPRLRDLRKADGSPGGTAAGPWWRRRCEPESSRGIAALHRMRRMRGRFNPFRVVMFIRTFTQGSSFLATLG